MAHQGESAGYYNAGPPPPQQSGYYQQQQNYSQQPPQYGQNYAAPQGPPPQQQFNNGGYEQQNYGDNKTFEQQFKVEKPKYNDLWAGLLFIVVFLGYVAVSAISIRGYSRSQKGGIYGNANRFALNSNTIILFAFVLGMAVLLSYAYMWAARAFTKQFIWITGILSKLDFSSLCLCLGANQWPRRHPIWLRNCHLHAFSSILVRWNRLLDLQHLLRDLLH